MPGHPIQLFEGAKSRRPETRPNWNLRVRHAPTAEAHRTGAETGRALVIEPSSRRAARGALSAKCARTPEARLEEAVGLARAIDLDVVESGMVTLDEIRPATFSARARSRSSPAS